MVGAMGVCVRGEGGEARQGDHKGDEGDNYPPRGKLQVDPRNQ